VKGDSEESSEEKPTKKRKAEEEPAEEEAPAAKKLKTTEANASDGDASTRVFIGNLSFQIDDDAIRKFFAEVGELTDIHWVTDRETGKFYGTGFITFATVEEAKAAVAKSGQEVLGRNIRIDFAQKRGERAPNSNAGSPRPSKGGNATGNRRESTPKPDGCTTVFLGNLSYQIDEQAVRDYFGECGDITAVRWVERDGKFTGCGFVEFSDTAATDKAVAKNGSDLLGRSVRVDFSAPKAPRQF